MTLLLQKRELPKNEQLLNKLLKESTSDDDKLPSLEILSRISEFSYTEKGYERIMKHIWKTLDSDDRKWRRIYKTLQLVQYLVANGSFYCVEELKNGREKFQDLKNFSHWENNQDISPQIKELARKVSALLREEDPTLKGKENYPPTDQIGQEIGKSRPLLVAKNENLNTPIAKSSRSTLDTLREATPEQAANNQLQSNRKTSLDLYVPLNKSPNMQGHNIAEKAALEKTKSNIGSLSHLDNQKYDILNELVTLPPPPGDKLPSFQKSKSLPVSMQNIEDLINSPIKPLCFESKYPNIFNFIQNNELAGNIMNVPLEKTSNQLNRNEHQQRYFSGLSANKPSSIPTNQNPSFCELYQNYKQNKQISTPPLLLKEEKSLNAPKSQSLTVLDYDEKSQFQNGSSLYHSVQTVNNKINSPFNSLPQPTLMRSQTLCNEKIDEVNISLSNLSIKKSVSVNIQSDRKYLEPSNLISDVSKPLVETKRAYTYTNIEELEQLSREFSVKTSLSTSNPLKRNEKITSEEQSQSTKISKEVNQIKSLGKPIMTSKISSLDDISTLSHKNNPFAPQNLKAK